MIWHEQGKETWQANSKRTCLVRTISGEVCLARTVFFEGDGDDDSGWYWAALFGSCATDPDPDLDDDPLVDGEGRSTVTHFCPVSAPNLEQNDLAYTVLEKVGISQIDARMNGDLLLQALAFRSLCGMGSVGLAQAVLDYIGDPDDDEEDIERRLREIATPMARADAKVLEDKVSGGCE